MTYEFNGFKESQYPYTTNTPLAVHEKTNKWLDPYFGRDPGGATYSPSERTVGPVGEVNLNEVVERMAVHGFPAPASIEWGELRASWATCGKKGNVTVSTRVAEMPAWVLDGVVCHELAHLQHPDHGSAFVASVNKFPFAKEVDGYLAAVRDGNTGIGAAPYHHTDEADVSRIVGIVRERERSRRRSPVPVRNTGSS